MLCRCESYPARPLPKYPDFLWDELERSIREDQVQAAGAKAFAQGLCCLRRCIGLRSVEQKLLEGKDCGLGTSEEEELQLELPSCLCNDVNSSIEKSLK